MLTCNGEQRTLASFTESAPAWLNASRASCEGLAACLWFHCRDRCVDGPALSRNGRSLKRKLGGGGGGGGGVGPVAGADGLSAALKVFDERGTVTVTPPSGGSMVKVGEPPGRPSGPLRLAPLRRSPVWTEPVDVVATLTSLPTRLAHTLETIRSLRQQTVPPKVIVVAVPAASGREGEAAQYAIPSFLLTTPGVCVVRTPRDWGPATKLVGLARELHAQGFIGDYRPPAAGAPLGTSGRTLDGAAAAGAGAIAAAPSPFSRLRLMVCDDDTWYPPRTVEALIRWSLRLPRAAIGQHGWVAHPDLVYAGNGKVGLVCLRGQRERGVWFAGVGNGKGGSSLSAQAYILLRTGLLRSSPCRANALLQDPLHYWGRHLSEPRPVSVLTGNTGYLLQPRHLDALFWEGLEAGELVGEGGAKAAPWAAASTGAKYMDDVWISGQLSRRGVLRLAVPMDKDEPRARWSGGDGPTLESVKGLGRKQMNDAALRAFGGLWDVLRCAPAAALASTVSSTVSPAVCAGPVALRVGTGTDLTALCQDDEGLGVGSE